MTENVERDSFFPLPRPSGARSARSLARLGPPVTWPTRRDSKGEDEGKDAILPRGGIQAGPPLTPETSPSPPSLRTGGRAKSTNAALKSHHSKKRKKKKKKKKRSSGSRQCFAELLSLMAGRRHVRNAVQDHLRGVEVRERRVHRLRGRQRRGGRPRRGGSPRRRHPPSAL